MCISYFIINTDLNKPFTVVFFFFLQMKQGNSIVEKQNRNRCICLSIYLFIIYIINY